MTQEKDGAGEWRGENRMKKWWRWWSQETLDGVRGRKDRCQESVSSWHSSCLKGSRDPAGAQSERAAAGASCWSRSVRPGGGADWWAGGNCIGCSFHRWHEALTTWQPESDFSPHLFLRHCRPLLSTFFPLLLLFIIGHFFSPFTRQSCNAAHTCHFGHLKPSKSVKLASVAS